MFDTKVKRINVKTSHPNKDKKMIKMKKANHLKLLMCLWHSIRLKANNLFLLGIFLSLTGAYQERTRLRDPAPGRMTARGRRETSHLGQVLSKLLRSPGSRLPPNSSEAHIPPRGSLTPQ